MSRKSLIHKALIIPFLVIIMLFTPVVRFRGTIFPASLFRVLSAKQSAYASAAVSGTFSTVTVPVCSLIAEAAETKGATEPVEASKEAKASAQTVISDTVSWHIKSETLYITGSGRIPDYSNANPAPWRRLSYTRVVVSDGITAVGDRAFQNNTEIKSVKLGCKVKRIGVKAFSFCMELSKINFPSGLRTIEADAFEFCDDLCEVKLPDSVLNVGEGAFYGCSKLKTLRLSASMCSINRSCFGFCTGLKKVKIPAGVIVIRACAFTHCYAMQKVVFLMKKTSGDAAGQGESIAKRAMKDKKFLFQLLSLLSKQRALLNPGLLIIGEEAFFCTGLKYAEIPPTVCQIGKQALGYHEISGGEDDPVDPFTVAGFTICGRRYSAAWKYAKKNGLKFEKRTS